VASVFDATILANAPTAKGFVAVARLQLLVTEKPNIA
jgi:hypothetical protein